MTDTNDFNAVANIMIPIENPEGSRNMIDIQNEEKMAHMEEELHQVRDLAKLSAITFPTFKTPIYFAKADLPNQPEQTQRAPTHGQVLPASPIAVRTVPELSNRDPTIPTCTVVNVPYKVDQYEEMEKDARLEEDTSINAQLQDIDMPVGYKPPKFDMFDGKGDPHAHLRAYCDKLVDVGRNEKLRMKTETVRVRPPLDESELSKYFIRAQECIYFDKMMSMMGQKFTELVKMGDFIEEGVKSGKIQSMVALQAASRAIQLGSIGGIKNKREDVSAVTYQLGGPSYVPVQAPIHQNRPAYVPRPHPNPEARNVCAYTSIVEPYTQLFERLRTTGVLQPVEGIILDPIPRNFDGNKRCAYHSEVLGHDTKDCYGLKNQIESLIRRGVIKCTPAPPNVNNNPLPNHKNLGPDYPNIDEADAMASSTQPKPEYDTKAVPWEYRAIIDELDGATFHTLEIMQAIRVNEGVEPEDTKLSSAVKMVASEMLKRNSDLFVAMVGEEEGINLNKLTIRNAELREILQNWTTSSSLFQPESC
ncbi:hypothetical protein H5410_016331 [Solanum commersonii]|uniref:Gag-pro-like protein n=1 Tax=Solanum commersonii TaxID=4109 RepID=A0A9J5ZWQ2_SOLCO|nr:hypothetical protein H5410_016331 [Solanum commersonii]